MNAVEEVRHIWYALYFAVVGPGGTLRPYRAPYCVKMSSYAVSVLPKVGTDQSSLAMCTNQSPESRATQSQSSP